MMGTLPLNIFPQYIAAEKMQYVVRATVQGMKALHIPFSENDKISAWLVVMLWSLIKVYEAHQDLWIRGMVLWTW